MIIAIAALFVYVAAAPETREKFLMIPSTYLWSAVRLDFFICMTALCALFCVGLELSLPCLFY
jgi:hypothetical protein